MSTRVMDTVGGIFRGFAECLVESASRLPDKEPRPPPSLLAASYRGHLRWDVDTVSTFVLAYLRDRGFVDAQVTHSPLAARVRFDLQHRCGSVARTFITEQAMKDTSRSQAPVLIAKALDRLGCYCVAQEDA